MKSPSLLPETAKYIGKDGACGFRTGESYAVEVFIRKGGFQSHPIICVSRVGDGRYFLPFRSVRKLLQNWDFTVG